MIVLAWLASCALSAGMVINASWRYLHGRPVSADYKMANAVVAVLAAILTAVVLTEWAELSDQL